MQINKKRLKYFDHDFLINRPLLRQLNCYNKDCEKCNYFPSMDEEYCEICFDKLFENDVE